LLPLHRTAVAVTVDLYLHRSFLRAIIEEFFNEVVQQFNLNDTRINKVITEVTTRDGKPGVLAKNLRSKYPNKTDINKLLRDPKVQKVVWEDFGLTCALPHFQEEYLYGAVSAVIHQPTIKKLVLSNELPEDYMIFFLQLADRYDKEVKLYDETLASGVDEDEVL
jgi:hypothetical protein